MKICENLTPDQMRERGMMIDKLIRENILEISGSDNIQGIELSNLIRRLANIMDAIFSQFGTDENLSGPRLGILFRLYGDEVIDGGSGVTPTMLSHMQGVSKNTISSLIKGLEDQNLIWRESDSADRRIYRLYLTDQGREYLKKNAPAQIESMNSLVSGLSTEEIDQLLTLLRKLQSSLMQHVNFHRMPGHEHFHEKMAHRFHRR
jgi:DNA-binding MarR family transcriptional regulator